MDYYAINRSGYLSHHGVKGMHWGVRRFQDATGRLTAEGRRRLGYSVERTKNTLKDPEFQRKAKKAAIGVGAAAATGAAAYAGYKIAGKRGAKKAVSMMPAVAEEVGKAQAMKAIKDGVETVARMQTKRDNPLATKISKAAIGFIPLTAAVVYEGITLSKTGKEIYDKHIEPYKDVKIKAGSHMYREDRNAKGDDLKTNVYLTSDRKDAKVYSDMWDRETGASSILTSDKTLKIAGKKAQERAYIKTHPFVGDHLENRELGKFLNEAIRDTDGFNAFKKELEKEGYNGVRDYNDLGWTKKPTIVFNEDKHLKSRPNVANEKAKAIRQLEKGRDLADSFKTTDDISEDDRKYYERQSDLLNKKIRLLNADSVASRSAEKRHNRRYLWNESYTMAPVIDSPKIKSAKNTKVKNINKDLIDRHKSNIDKWIRDSGFIPEYKRRGVFGF